jgi:predicted phosphoribosyltransferase
VNFRFQDRAEAGRLLAEKLQAYAGRADVVVLGLPRGGVPVAFEVARKLQLPLYAFLVRKLGVPGREELAMGAIASGDVCSFNAQVIAALGIPQRIIDGVIARERQELARLEHACHIGPLPDLRHRTVILVDDGLATGASMRAAVMAARELRPARIVVAVPVAARESHQEFQREADEIVCVETPEQFEGVGKWYDDFSQTTDEEVRKLLQKGEESHEKLERI